jgi:hypothetical protein
MKRFTATSPYWSTWATFGKISIPCLSVWSGILVSFVVRGELFTFTFRAVGVVVWKNVVVRLTIEIVVALLKRFVMDAVFARHALSPYESLMF